MIIHKLAALVCASVIVVGLAVHAAGQKEVAKDVRSRLFKQALTDSGERECIDREEGGVRAAEANMSVEQVDLNHDGVSEYEVELSGPCTCGMVNCSIYLYRQAPGGFELILDDAAGFSFELLKTSSNGYFDVRVTARNNAATQDRTTYKFDGKQYREADTRLVQMQTGESKPAYRRVQFKRGSSSTTVQGRVSISLPDTYLVGARAGQVMTVTLTAPSRSVKFTIMTSHTTNMLADNTRSWTGTLPESDDYLIVVEGDEKGGTYSMTISIK